MNEALRQKLCDIVNAHGTAVADDPNRCGELLRQTAPEDGDGVEALLCALKAHVPARLALLTEPLALVPLTAGLVRRLIDEQGLSELSARWAVESWAIALGKGTEVNGTPASTYQHLVAPPRRSRWRILRYVVPVVLVVGSIGGWWWAAQRSEERRIGGRTGGVDSMVLSKDGRIILGACGDKLLRVWDVDSGAELRAFEGHQWLANCVALSPDGRLALSAGGRENVLPYDDTTIRVWDMQTGKARDKALGDSHVPVYCVAFSPDGKLALAGMGGWETLEEDKNKFQFKKDGSPTPRECVVRIYNVETGAEVRKLEGHKEPIRCAAFTPDGERIVSAGSDHWKHSSLRLWDVASGKELRKVALPDKLMIECLAISPDGHKLLTGDSDSRLALWDLDNLEMERDEKHTAQSVRGVAFSPDGKRALSGGDDYKVRLWNIPDLTEVRHFPGHTATVTGVAFLPDGNSGVSSSLDGTIRVWRLPR